MGTSPRTRTSPFALLGALALGCSSSPAPEAVGIDHSPDTGLAGFCRTTTCSPGPDYPTADGECQPPDWSDSPTCRNDPKKPSNAPVWWRSACVGYDLQQNASRHVSYDAFASAAAGAFTMWTAATCPSTGASSRVSIDVRDLGPASCNRAVYNQDGPNQNVIVFHDDVWPYEQRDRQESGTSPSPTIALTTVTFDPGTGELFDADIELNSADHPIVPLGDVDAGAEGAYDLQAILTHEIGHFLGLAHSPLPAAVMYASGDTTSGTRKRLLTEEDVRGICTVYLPDGSRSVSSLVESSGKMSEGTCDPTPRHGLTYACN